MPEPAADASRKIRVILTRREHFSASHRLWNPEQDERWNRETYGPCSNLNGHGHNYILEVSIQGYPDASGMIVNLKDIKKVLFDKIINHVDHKHLNHDVPFLQGIIPTTENVLLAFWRELAPEYPEGALCRLVLRETEKNMVEICLASMGGG